MKQLRKSDLQIILDQAMREFTAYPKLRYFLQADPCREPTHILALGKAAFRMAELATQSLPANMIKSTIVLTKYGCFPSPESRKSSLHILEAGHPILDANSLKHSAFIVNWLEQIPPHEALIVLISGGSSALFEIPAPGHSLQDLIGLNSLLLKSGLDISQINARRKTMSQVKGGQAAQYFHGKNLRVFALSDVPKNEFSNIGSGPFYLPQIPNHYLIGDFHAWLKVLARQLKQHFPDYPIRISPRFITADATKFGQALAHYGRTAETGIYLFGGECSLKVQGPGKGGRLSHLALCFAKAARLDRKLSLCVYATDGNDHLPQYAGAYVDQDSFNLMQKLGNPDDALINYDSYSILRAADATLPAQYTGCNVNDSMILFVTD